MRSRKDDVFSDSIRKLLTPVISVKEMLKRLFGAVLIILQSWEFSKISPQNPENAISETLDSKFSGGACPRTPRISRVFGARQPHFEKASPGRVYWNNQPTAAFGFNRSTVPYKC